MTIPWAHLSDLNVGGGIDPQPSVRFSHSLCDRLPAHMPAHAHAPPPNPLPPVPSPATGNDGWVASRRRPSPPRRTRGFQRAGQASGGGRGSSSSGRQGGAAGPFASAQQGAGAAGGAPGAGPSGAGQQQQRQQQQRQQQQQEPPGQGRGQAGGKKDTRPLNGPFFGSKDLVDVTFGED